VSRPAEFQLCSRDILRSGLALQWPASLYDSGRLLATVSAVRCGQLDAQSAWGIILALGQRMKIYDLVLQLEEIQDGGDYHYLATSPDLPGLLVAGDTAEEVLSLAPSVAGALIASLQAEGDPLPATIRPVSSFPLITHVAVTASRTAS